MFRILKLAAYAMFGWFLYEVLRSFSTPPKPREHRIEQPRVPHEMRDEPVYDPSGARHTQKVGRGVMR